MAPKFICFLCQDYTEHQTKNCPNLKCMSCGQLGHARKDCQSITDSESTSMLESGLDSTRESQAETENNYGEEIKEKTYQEIAYQLEESLLESESQHKNEETESPSNESEMEEGELDSCDEICEICNSEHILEIMCLKDKPMNRCVKYIGERKGEERTTFLKCGKL